MPPGSWQNAEDYASCGALPGNALAWQYLARNKHYLKQRKQLGRRAERTMLTDEDCSEFAMRWGVLAQEEEEGKVSWTAGAFPGSLFVIAAMPEAIIGEPLALPFGNGAGTYVAGEVSVTLLGLDGDEAAAAPTAGYAVLVPLDELVDVRLQAVKHLADRLRGKPAKPFPPPLSKPRRDRLINGLRALDGRAAGASYREIATVLFGEAAVSKREWKAHDLRDRTIRLVRDAIKMMEGGYRRLLLHPHRGRLTGSD